MPSEQTSKEVVLTSTEEIKEIKIKGNIKEQPFFRFVIFVIGILILAFGVALTILSNSGTSPFDATLVGLSNKVGLTVGSWEIIISFLIIFCNSLLLRKRPEFLGLLTAIFTGFGIDLWLFLLGPIIHPENMVSELFILCLGIILVGLGTAIYLLTKFTPSPLDRLMLVFREKFGLNILYSRTIVYAIFLAIAFIVGGPIGIGILLTAILGGPILNFFMSALECIIQKQETTDKNMKSEL